MIRSELVDRVALANRHLKRAEADAVVGAVLDAILGGLARGRRVELRGFGAFSVRDREARIGRNPRTGTPIDVPDKRVPYFKAGKEMRARLNVEGLAE